MDNQKRKYLVYLDHAATTYLDSKVKQAMEPYFSCYYANPSALYGSALEVNGALNDARRSVAQILHALPDNIIFTGGGTESDNLAIFGVAYKNKLRGRHIVTTKIEHHAVLNPIQRLESEGFSITYLEVDEFGRIDLEEFKRSLKDDTILVSIMYANNEIGTIQPIAEIGKEILKWRKQNNTLFPYFHTDACQAAGALELDVEKLHVDLMTLNGSKIYGPKGVGVLYKRRGAEIQPQILGGGQEMGLRSGTENIPGIVGLAKALELVQANRNKETKKLRNLVTYFWGRVQKEITKVRLNGPEIGERRLPNNLNFSILDIEGEAMLLYLDAKSICCSTGSACTSTSLEPSHVLTACGLPYEYAHGSLRFTLGHCNTKKDIDYVMKYLPGIVEKLRKISPVNLQFDPKNNKHAKIHQR